MEVEGIFSEIIKTATSGIESIDGKRKWDRKKWETPPGIFDISIYRGEALEKASIARVSLVVNRVITGPGEKLALKKLEGCQINIFPSNPLLPAGMFNLEKREMATDRLGGYISIFPMKENDKISENLQETFSSALKKHGKDKSQVLKEYGELWQDLDWQFKGERGIGMKISGGKEDLKAISDSVILMIKEYLDCIGRAKDIKFSDDEKERMFSFRLKLTEFILLKDPSTKFCFANGVSLETLTSMILPPVRF